ncbi:hypothetical protein AMTRI_Chr09g34820 [Amborella trichopoda]
MAIVLFSVKPPSILFPLHSTPSKTLNPASLLLFRNARSNSYHSAVGNNGAIEPEEEVHGHGGRAEGYGGLQFESSVAVGSKKERIDSWLSARIVDVSRARIQSSIRQGFVKVNGLPITKVSHIVKVGDMVDCTVSHLQPLKAEPEDMPLDIIYEDDHVLVVNKPAHMVVHPAPGNANGTLVNGILHHCRLPAFGLPDGELTSESDDECDNGLTMFNPDPISTQCRSSIRPGIVHRLDKGTSGLLVVAKNEHSHAHLSEQFKLHTIHRQYISLTCGVPSPSNGCIEIPIARDMNNRIRMAAVSGQNNTRKARLATSRYHVMEVLAGGGSALVEWRLQTGRTHQIRVHAKYIGNPLLGDEVYGGTKSMALSRLRPRTPSHYHGPLSQLVSNLQRPCLHAFSLGFKHPHSEENVLFTCPPPPDFAEVLRQLQSIKSSNNHGGLGDQTASLSLFLC